MSVVSRRYGGRPVSAVTLAPIRLPSAPRWWTAFAESSGPSVGIRMLVYIVLLPGHAFSAARCVVGQKCDDAIDLDQSACRRKGPCGRWLGRAPPNPVRLGCG